MKGVAGAVLVLVALLPVPGRAQTSPSGGERVRVQQWGGLTVTGALAGTSASELTILAGPGSAEMTIPMDDVKSMERSLGRQRRFGKNFLLGLGLTSAAAGFVSAVTWKPCTPKALFDCFLHPASRGEAMAMGLVGGAVLGLPIGIIAGLAIKEEIWERTDMSDQQAPRVSLVPVLGPDPGLSASVSLTAF